MFSKNAMVPQAGGMIPAVLVTAGWSWAGVCYGFRDFTTYIRGSLTPLAGYSEIWVWDDDLIVHCTKPFLIVSSGNYYSNGDKFASVDWNLFKSTGTPINLLITR